MQTKKQLPAGRFVFAEEKDFPQIKALWQEAFNDEDEYVDGYLSEYYNDRRIFLFKSGDEVVSMASLFLVELDDKPAIYIYALATKNEYKSRGIARKILDIIQMIFECKLILQPEKNGVEKFYEKIGFSSLDSDRLYSVCEKFNITDMTLGRFDGYERAYRKPSVNDIKFSELDAESIDNTISFFNLRKNKACESTPLCLYLYRHIYTPLYCVFNDACFVLYKYNGKIVGATLPYCDENMLVENFKIQEKYFNEILKINHKIYSCNCEGFEALKSSGVLDNYDAEEHPIFKDYLYDGESMRTLSGKKLSKKRNLIHQFEKNYEGRWEYSALTFDDKNETLEFVEKWYKDYPNKEDKFLIGEHKGLVDVISHKEMYDFFKFGAIRINGEIKAISVGSLNKLDNVAIIDVEKADPNINGLYQIINREFLLHEFPKVDIVNREDDVGEENLRKAKMSYNPIGFELKYNMTQK